MTSILARATPLATSIVDLDAIARNVGRLVEAADVPLMAVVKADAFGHGALEVARTALAAGARWFGTATIEEALELRDAGIDAPIFSWLVDPWTPLEEAIVADITLSCPNVETLAAIRAAAVSARRTAAIHLELDTGMARGGSTPELWPTLCRAAAVGPGEVLVTGIWSHLALAGRTSAAGVAGPVDALLDAFGVARAAGLAPRDVHLANSAGILAHRSTHLTMVRSAAALYGIQTVEGAQFSLEPALRLQSRVSQLRDVSRGDGVGYGHEWHASTDTRLALVPIGYGDGVPRALSRGGWVSIGGVRCPVRGTVSMDQFVVEVPPHAALGDEVVLLGDGRHGEPTAQQWATLAETLPHDILAGLGRRIRRTHIGAAA